MKQIKIKKVHAPVRRFFPSVSQGLTLEQITERKQEGYQNTAKQHLDKTAGQIIRDNLFTFFNLVFLVLALCLFAVGAYTDMLFLGVIIINTLIGIVQELRVKRTLEKISLLSHHNATAVRNGQKVSVPSEELVLDDIVLFRTGSQICADAILCEGTLEVNESLLTGESRVIAKQAGDSLLSGSFVTAGNGYARLDRVGDDCYAASITYEARRHKKYRSEMMRSLDRWLKIIGIAIIPLGSIMFIQQYFLQDTGLYYTVSSTVAAIVGMIPEGLYLLVSTALAVSVIKLARHDTLVHELSCIENLARVDVLCLDKTGTITEGCMGVTGLLPAFGTSEAKLIRLLSGFVHSADEDNSTAKALKEYFSPVEEPWQPKHRIPFSSARKWNAVELEDGQDYILGAPEIVLGDNYSDCKPLFSDALAAGQRVLVFAGGNHILLNDILAKPPTPLGFIILSDRIRTDAAETLAYFRGQGVAIKVNSGDNAAAVSEIARQAGVEDADRWLDAQAVTDKKVLQQMAEDYTVFGRVSPQQKRDILRGLQQAGHTVAMLGDGVNDVLALKDADCSIAMASGSEAAKQAAQLVLLNSDFSAMPQIVKEGRRVINTIGRSASLFLVKNIFSILVSFVLLFAALPYPLLPIQISLFSGLMIGIPSFLLTFEPVYERVKGQFLLNALLNALPGGLTGTLILLGTSWMATRLNLPVEQLSSIGTLLIGINGLMTLLFLCRPLNGIRIILISFMGILFAGAFFLFPQLFHISPLTSQSRIICGLFSAAIPFVMCGITAAVNRIKKGLNGQTKSKRVRQIN